MSFNSKADFKKVFLEYYNPLCNFANGLLKDEMSAEDCVQDVFINLWTNRHQIIINHGISSYLFKATKNKAIEYIRSKNNRTKLSENVKLEPLESALEDELAKDYLRMEKLNNSLRHLPPKCREVFVSHKFKGLTYAEIGELNNISIKTVENHMLKAMKILRTKLTDENEA